MKPDDNKALVAEYIRRVWNDADPAALDELCGPFYTYRLGGQPPRDRAAMKEFIQAIHAVLSAMLSDFYRFTGLCRICLRFPVT